MWHFIKLALGFEMPLEPFWVIFRSVEGPSITVSTEDGDIHVWNDCRADVSKFCTRRGSIHVRDLHNQVQ